MQSESPGRHSKTVTFPAEELPFTDRTVELQKLRSLIQRIGEGNDGTIVLISGEPGIGKTRLCQEARKFAQSKNYRWLSAKCSRAEDLDPYSPWIQLLREFTSQASVQLFYKVCGPYLNEIVKLIPELAETAVSQNASVGVSSAEETMQRRLRFFQSLTQFFVKLSKESPMILMFDDLQWADPATIQLLNFFRTNAPSDSSILILTCYRDFELSSGENPAANAFLKELQIERKNTLIHLERFDEVNVEKVLSSISGHDGVSSEFTELIFSKTGGNPLFIEEVLRSLLEKGDVFKTKEGQWDRKSISEIEIPLNIQGLIKQRLNRLDKDTLEVLRIASVIGDSFEPQMLGQISSEHIDEVRLGEIIKLALNSGVLREKRVIQRGIEDEEVVRKVFFFNDETVHDILYEDLDELTQKRIHLKVGIFLEKSASGTSSNEIVSDLAIHFLKAGVREKALDYALRAGDRAGSLFAHEEAARFYKQALDLLARDARNELLRAQILTKLGEEVSLQLGSASSLGYLEEAATILEKNGFSKEAAALFARIGEVYIMVLNDRPNATRCVDKIIELVSSDPPGFLLSYGYTGRAIISQWSGENEKALEALSKAKEVAQNAKDLRAESIADYFAVEMLPVSKKESALADVERATQYFLKTNDVRNTTMCLYLRAVAYSAIKANPRESLRLFSEALDYATKVNSVGFIVFGKSKIFETLLLSGEWDKARLITRELQDMSEKFPKNVTLHLLANAASGRLLLFEGNIVEAQGYLSLAARDLRGFGGSFVITPLIDLGRAHSLSQNYLEAQVTFDEAYNQSKKTGLALWTVNRHIELLYALIEFNVSRRASVTLLNSYLTELSEVAAEVNESWSTAYYEQAQGIISVYNRNFEIAAECFEKSLAVWRSIGWLYETGKTLCLKSSALHERGESEVSQKDLEEALAIFRKLGAKREEEISRGLLEKCTKAIVTRELGKNERTLAAIMFTDIVGYTKLTQEDESSAIALLEEHRKVLRPIFKRHFGREVDTKGDAFMVEFGSALEAARCSVDIQKALDKRNSSVLTSPNRSQQCSPIKIRIGIHLGDVERKDGNIYGDAVNIASRIEPLAEPGGVCITQQVYDQIRNYSSEFSFERLGAKELKNVNLPYEIYRIIF
jgi:predicted ATPase/class 3 adenylate cyclase